MISVIVLFFIKRFLNKIASTAAILWTITFAFFNLRVYSVAVAVAAVAVADAAAAAAAVAVAAAAVADAAAALGA